MDKHEEILSKYEELDGFVTYQNALKAMQEYAIGLLEWADKEGYVVLGEDYDNDAGTIQPDHIVHLYNKHRTT